ncbi:hypothetical protein BE20_19690 [Sorangium cellulosum]|uniref:Uncharacterized protein n=1 Tax=Sorangium cellulosum TaxID=56 RepID=A0A150T3T4_SORCE|nr:hypothetical protein BE20_19690 [Sorangium cellulosum]KYF99147.1 hypothetical protein BE18_25195 [Sorangium cellulosum]
MNRIDDPRAVFYLRNQPLIEEWAAIGESVADLAHGFLCSCADGIAELASELSPDVDVYKFLEDDEDWPKILLVLPGWFPSSQAGLVHGVDVAPRVGVGLEWNKSRRLNFTTSPACAFTGVWVDIDIAGGKELSRKLRAAFGEAGILKQHRLTSSAWWPAYRYETATGDYWNDLAPYREQLIQSVRSHWMEFAPRIRDVLAG